MDTVEVASGKSLRVLEFYSGVGGMHYALQRTGVFYEVLQALDMNEVANVVYAHNFPTVPVNTTDIGRLGEEWLDKQGADLWTMSPPCQPYTRGGLQKGSKDARSSSLLCLLEALQKMRNPPTYLLLENVKGFELSDTFEELQKTLDTRGYSVQNFLLSPQQFGIPNSRVRFYCLAKRLPGDRQGRIWETIPSSAAPAVERKRTLAEYLETLDADQEEQCSVPSSFLKSLARGYRFDIVTPSDDDSTCFTKNYAKNFKGSGPLFLPCSPSPSKEEIAGYDVDALRRLKLRFFSPREIANLLCFPSDFTFPETVTTKQAYRLLGNSINVHVVSLLMRHLLTDDGEPTK